MTYIKAGLSLTLDSALCTGCGICLDVCPHAVFSLQNQADEGEKSSISNRERCMECGACRQNCPVNAIAVKSGVGCVGAIINGMFRGGEVSCDCGSGGKDCC